MTTEISQLELRLTRLEKQNRRLKQFGLLAVVGWIAVTFAGGLWILTTTGRFHQDLQMHRSRQGGSSPDKTLVVEKLYIRGADGKNRLVLSADPGDDTLVLLDPFGKKGVALASQRAGRGLFLFDAEEQLRVSLAVVDVGSSLIFSDTDRNAQLSLEGANEGGAGFFLRAGIEKKIAELKTHEGKTSLVIYDSSGKPLFSKP
jgi:hypothetical protein